jgi:hypothetical protein
MSATMYGCEIVCAHPIWTGMSSYARLRSLASVNASRGTVRMASRTRGS